MNRVIDGIDRITYDENEQTPGPWWVYDGNEDRTVRPGPLWCVANDAFHEPYDPDNLWLNAEIQGGSKRDASLMAAAPELDEAVQCLMDYIRSLDVDISDQHYQLAMSMGRDARAKARGEDAE